MNDSCRLTNERPEIPACVGSEWGILIGCDPPTQRSSHASDDDFEANCFVKVIPAKAGIQDCYFADRNQPVERLSRVFLN